MSIPLEDGVADILGKARRGLGLADEEVAARAGLSPEAWGRLLQGGGATEELHQAAPVLGLHGGALAGLGSYQPAPVRVSGLAAFNTPWEDMTVNAYLVWDGASREAVAFDTGADCTAMLDTVQREGLQLRTILLTHTHGDHIFELDRLCSATGAKAYVSSREPLDGAEPFEPGAEFRCGALKIRTRLTWGHSPGGITYVIEGLGRPVAVVGDAIFAGSMGGGIVSYADALRTNREEIFSLPDDTVLCPGHGPLTTVGEERKHNPFFAATL